MSATPSRRLHDFDALRATAMLLGIVLHAAKSFTPIPWPVRDSQQSPPLGLLIGALHGFRMPLFFLISGFFTAMLWRRRGLPALLKHRFSRVLIPCLLGLVTIMPIFRWVSVWVAESAASSRANVVLTTPESRLAQAISEDNQAEVVRLLSSGTDPSGRDPEFGVTMLGWAALAGDTESAGLLLERGADVDGRNGDLSTPLHCAAFLGHNTIVEMLMRRGADASARNNKGELPSDSASAEWGATQYLAGILRLELRPRAEVQEGRAACRARLGEVTGAERGRQGPSTKAEREADLFGLRSSYRAFLVSDRLRVRWKWGSEPLHLFLTSVLGHLWFLWYLWILVLLFAGSAWLATRFRLPGPPTGLILSPWAICWLLPLTMIPQWFMGVFSPGFGPDTSTGVLPQPHVLVYYGIFFGYGALYHDCDDTEGRLGRRWWLTLPFAVIVALPIGMVTMRLHAISGIAQVVYTWMMTFGLIGLFRSILAREDKAIRYVSDSSYWLYLAHLPLIVALQHMVRGWPVAATTKLWLICTVSIGMLLLSYRLFVRYTWLGTLLNGRRERPGAARLDEDGKRA